jgi:hypothetical protein
MWVRKKIARNTRKVFDTVEWNGKVRKFLLSAEINHW